MITWQAQIRGKKRNILLDSEGKFLLDVKSDETLLAIYLFTHKKKNIQTETKSHHKSHWAFIVLKMFETKDFRFMKSN